MSSDTGDKTPTTIPPPPTTGKNNNHVKKEPEQLPCPRCNSNNTKFCYYNNYNFSQPRHYCKSCRRYWTHGGALRDIPVGGATRRNAKRARLSVPPVCSSNNNNNVMIPFTGDYSGNGGGSFTSLLSASQNNYQHHHHQGFYGFDQDLSFGVGRTFWPFNGGLGGGITWQMETGGGGGDGGGDCFVLPELAISTPGKSTIN